MKSKIDKKHILELSRQPLALELNRVERLYTGGKLLDQWQGLPAPTDGHWSEEFLVATTEYIGHSDHVPHSGLSRTKLGDDSYMTLRELIALDESDFLGDRYVGQTRGQAGVLARIGDSTVRLVIQVHPDRAGAQRYLDFPSGKTEVWYILNTRTIDGEAPYAYVGFKPGVTKARWRAVFDSQDIDGMLDCMHRIPLNTGDAVLIPAGMPHAMGAGCLFLEIHEACDYTFRLEKTYLGATVSDELLHYGIGLDAMFDLFKYEGYSESELLDQYITRSAQVDRGSKNRPSHIVSYEDTDRFAVDLLTLNGSHPLPEFDGHMILVTASGDTELSHQGGSVTVPQGRGVFVPANARGIAARGHGEVVIGYPFML